MSPAGPAWPRLRVLQTLWALLVVLLAPWRLWAIKNTQECTWQVVLNNFETVGKKDASDRFVDQEPLYTVDKVFSQLVDAPVDPDETYLGFPYYLKINYSCKGESSEALVRKGHLTGLKPVVLVTFQSPVNFHRWKIEQLQIQMEAAPFRSRERCNAEEVCLMSWYTPMPIKNGSVVMRVDVSSNGLGPFIPNKRFQVNINGFLERQRDNTLQFTVGNELFNLIPRYFVNVPSRPLWYTVDQAPVFILGGIPEEKAILLTDTNFKDFFLVELSIDSCWVGSFYCPQTSFTATIYDAIATESTLFIRQNQLIYYFTGTYTTLHESNRGSGRWVRVLANECIKKLCPVHFHSNGSEYVMALTTGKHEGYVHFGTITDGRVSFELLPRQRSVCSGILVVNCSITWAVFIAGDYNLLLLVEIEDPSTRKYFQVVSYDLVSDYLVVLYTIPEFIPDARGLEFLMVLGTESYTNFPMVPKGMSYNPYNNLLFIWGNFLLQSYNSENFIYLADFPKELSIKYLVNSFYGDTAIVTETEEIWYLLEGSYQVYKLFPSKGWQVHVSLQVMQQSSLYAPNETMVTLFYEDHRLYQVLSGGLWGRHGEAAGPLMWPCLLAAAGVPYRQPAGQARQEACACGAASDVPADQQRLPLGAAREPPDALLHQLLPLHGDASAGPAQPADLHAPGALPGAAAVCLGARGLPQQQLARCLSGTRLLPALAALEVRQAICGPGARPHLALVEEQEAGPGAWRGWRIGGRAEPDPPSPSPCPGTVFAPHPVPQDYYFYLASNWRSAGSVHVDMASYEKIYDLKAENELPERIFLDKGTSYRFSVFLTAREPEPVHGPSFQLQSKVGLAVVLADPECIEAVVKEKVVVNRNSVLFWVTLSDKRFCFDQGISGHHLIKTSMLLKVVGSSGHCFQNTNQGPRMWLCMENSPCHDTIPHSIFASEFFFKVLVSNRGVDKSTYCDYQLTFQLHIHGLPLSARRAFLILMVSASLFVGLVILYVISCLLSPYVVKVCNVLCWKINNIIAWESYIYSIASDTGAFSNTSGIKSGESSGGISRVVSKVAGENRTDTKETLRKKPIS
ncbi:cation channel sperm-associated auxiliary subunit gamma isoform X3 [Sagmatias obliquidens]|uniref:cation channel sperm-associated auxiliary subunit gamma isoform X3 n=1 Tax=Sagmatias obliquidens TaxID=3371155 RepID=UPI000F443869|nr:cation channel sperm-associated protein subunit gamma isoform X3 [Lagenorhynchus obliquidens]